MELSCINVQHRIFMYLDHFQHNSVKICKFVDQMYIWLFGWEEVDKTSTE